MAGTPSVDIVRKHVSSLRVSGWQRIVSEVQLFEYVSQQCMIAVYVVVHRFTS